MYQIIKKDGVTKVRKLPEKEEPKRNHFQLSGAYMQAYQNYKTSLEFAPTYPTSGMDHLPEGMKLEDNNVHIGYEKSYYIMDEQQRQQLGSEKQLYLEATLLSPINKVSMEKIYSINIITLQGVSGHVVGCETNGKKVASITREMKYTNGDGYEFYIGRTETGEVIFQVDALCPIEIIYS